MSQIKIKITSAVRRLAPEYSTLNGLKTLKKAVVYIYEFGIPPQTPIFEREQNK